MRALSIRQPWALLILRPDLAGYDRQEWLNSQARKDIENRTWSTRFRGTILVHAGQGMTRDEYCIAQECAYPFGIALPPFPSLERGGIVGQVDIIDCVSDSLSQWFFGEYGFVLENPVALPFCPCKGALGFFDPVTP